MSFTLQFDDNFTNSPVSGSRSATFPTAVGSGANSTTAVGNGWIDFAGGYYNLPSSGVLQTSNTTPSNLPLNSLYRPSSENYRDGYVRGWSSGGAEVGLTARFNPASGGSGYAAMIYAGNSLYIYNAVNGTQGSLVAGHVLTVPASYVMEMVLSTPSAGTTQITVNIYAQSDLTTVVSTYTTTDSTAALQTSGAWGVSSYGQAAWSRVQTAVQGSALTAGTASTGIISRHQISLSATAPTGGTAPYSYQWRRGTASGAETAIAGATSQAYVDTGLTAGITYFYTCAVTDSAGTPATVTTAEVSATTLAATANVILGIGDSTMLGTGTSNPATNNCLVKMGQALVATYGHPTPGIINDAVGGSNTTTWQPGSANFARAVADANTYESTDIWLRLGINDAANAEGNTGLPAATYQTQLGAIVAALHAQCPTVQHVWVSYPQYVTVHDQWDATSQSLLLAYQAPAQAVAAANAPVAEIGNIVSYQFFSDNPSLLADGTHPNDAGAADLGAQDATAFAVRSLALPPAAGYALGSTLDVVDPTGVTTSARPLALTPHAGDTLNAATATLTTLTGVGAVRLYSDGITGWNFRP